jgi:hypothetical protein
VCRTLIFKNGLRLIFWTTVADVVVQVHLLDVFLEVLGKYLDVKVLMQTFCDTIVKRVDNLLSQLRVVEVFDGDAATDCQLTAAVRGCDAHLFRSFDQRFNLTLVDWGWLSGAFSRCQFQLAILVALGTIIFVLDRLGLLDRM